MDGISLKRKEVIERWFARADDVLRKIYVGPDYLETKKKLEWNDEIEADIKSITVSYLANYVGIVDPSLKPELLRIVSRLADLEIDEQSIQVGSNQPNLKLVD